MILCDKFSIRDGRAFKTEANKLKSMLKNKRRNVFLCSYLVNVALHYDLVKRNCKVCLTSSYRLPNEPWSDTFYIFFLLIHADHYRQRHVQEGRMFGSDMSNCF